MKQERIFNISIAGCGKVAHLHAKAIQNIPNARLTGVWSRTHAKAKDFASMHKTKAYSDISRMVFENESDLVIVCTAHPFHKQPAIEAAEAGANVLVEKPLAADLRDCDAVINACRLRYVKLGVVSQRRWYSPSMRVKRAIDDGKIGKPVLATITMLGWRDKAYYDADAWRGTWRDEGGGVLVNQAPHQLDLMLWYMGDIDEVYGQWRNLNHSYIEVDDTALAIVKFKSGAMFIAGRSGVAEAPVNDLWTVPGEEKMLPLWVREDNELFKKYDPAIYYMQCQTEDFLRATENDTEPLVRGEDGRKTVELFSAIYRSTRDNKPVKFPLRPEPGFDGRADLP